jgi:hypothetical protein
MAFVEHGYAGSTAELSTKKSIPGDDLSRAEPRGIRNLGAPCSPAVRRRISPHRLRLPPPDRPGHLLGCLRLRAISNAAPLSPCEASAGEGDDGLGLGKKYERGSELRVLVDCSFQNDPIAAPASVVHHHVPRKILRAVEGGGLLYEDRRCWRGSLGVAVNLLVIESKTAGRQRVIYRAKAMFSAHWPVSWIFVAGRNSQQNKMWYNQQSRGAIPQCLSPRPKMLAHLPSSR